MALTDMKIRNAKPGKGRYLLCDGDGLNLEVMTSGSKFWRMRYTEEGKERRATLGRYPDVSLADARVKRDELRAAMGRGEKPSVILNPPQVPTFKDVAGEWLEKQAAVLTPHYIRGVRFLVERYLYSALGDRPLKEITAPELLAVLRSIEETGKVDTTHRTHQAFGQIARYGIAIGACDFDVSSALVDALKTHKVKPMAALTKVEDIRRLILGIDTYSGTVIVKTALWVSLYTLARPGEVRHAEWSEVDTEAGVWSIPAGKMKKRKPHAVPLCRQCVEVLKMLYQFTGRGRYVFPSARDTRGNSPMSCDAVRMALRTMGFTNDDMTAHGFRSLGSTRLNEMGFKPDLIEAALAHTQGGVRAIYNRTDYWEERKKMMQAWGDWLEPV